MSQQPIVHIEHWGITTHPSYPDSEPCLRGVVTGHPRFPDEHTILSTSPIQELRAGRVVTQSGTIYELGKPHPEAFSTAFALRREFAYLVLLLWFVSTTCPNAPPAVASTPEEQRTPAPVLAFAALPDGKKTSIQ